MIDKRFEFRLTDSDRQMLEEKASQAGLSPSEYLRAAIRGNPIDYPAIRKEIQQLKMEISKIGTNVNQIARANNIGLYSMQDRRDLLAAMKIIQQLLNQYIQQNNSERRPDAF